MDGSSIPHGWASDAAAPDLVAPDLAGLKALLAAPPSARERTGGTLAPPRPGDAARLAVLPARSKPDADAGAVLQALQSVARGRADPTSPEISAPLAAMAERSDRAAAPEGSTARPDPGMSPSGVALDGRLRTDGGAGLSRVASRIGPAVAATLAASAGPDAMERFQAKVLRQETHLPVLVELSVAGQQVADALQGLPSPSGPTATAGADPVRVDLTAPPLHVLEIQLQPEELGSVRVELRAAGDRLAVRIIADEPETARLLTEDASALGRKLEAAGYTADGLLIQVVSDAGLPRLPVSSTGANGNPAANGGQAQAGNGQPGGGQPSGGPGQDGSGRNDHAQRDDTFDGGGTPGDGGVWL
ncbi:flagellar hook-length control protein FliK [Mongoliimonas terrestris]|uniref:flagellar hook-length control protein FliK n=1 Tax=Mongoliimonas terrestris TaxID=1709001 RepID=UPI00111517B6|nr:flagellar hook-length control protein FliK [Mongoliimonas terrestris]